MKKKSLKKKSFDLLTDTIEYPCIKMKDYETTKTRVRSSTS